MEKTEVKRERKSLKAINQEGAQLSKAVFLVPNLNIKATPKRYVIKPSDDISNVLEGALDLLKLPAKAKYLYTIDGVQVTDLSNVEPKSTLVVLTSNDHGFFTPMSPERRQQIRAEIKAKSITSPSIADREEIVYSPSDDSQSVRSQITVSSQKRSHYARYHQLLSVLPGTVEDHIRDSMLASYSTMSADQRQQLPDGPMYQEMIHSTRVHLFHEQMMNQLIIAPTATSNIQDHLNQWALSLLKEATVSKLRIAISGPRYSGKTTLLFTLASIFYRKLLHSNLAEDYLMFPLNFAQHSLYFNDPFRIYPIFVNAIFAAARYARFELVSFILPLKEWFLGAITVGTMPKIPLPTKGLPTISPAALTAIGQEFHEFFHQTKSPQKRGNDPVLDFYNKLVTFPARFAQAIGMSDAFYVIDHFDCAPRTIGKLFGQVASPFFVASQDDASFFKRFKNNDALQVYTENAILVDDDRQITSGPIRLTVASMQGMPAFLSSFLSICKMLENDNKPATFSTFTTKAESSKKWRIAQEVKRLMESLVMASGSEEDGVKADWLNEFENPSIEFQLS